MRLNRIFCDGPLAGRTEIDLPAAGAYHVARVLRMREGAPLSIFDGSGQEFRAEIVRVHLVRRDKDGKVIEEKTINGNDR